MDDDSVSVSVGAFRAGAATPTEPSTTTTSTRFVLPPLTPSHSLSALANYSASVVARNPCSNPAVVTPSHSSLAPSKPLPSPPSHPLSTFSAAYDLAASASGGGGVCGGPDPKYPSPPHLNLNSSAGNKFALDPLLVNPLASCMALKRSHKDSADSIHAHSLHTSQSSPVLFQAFKDLNSAASPSSASSPSVAAAAYFFDAAQSYSIPDSSRFVNFLNTQSYASASISSLSSNSSTTALESKLKPSYRSTRGPIPPHMSQYQHSAQCQQPVSPHLPQPIVPPPSPLIPVLSGSGTANATFESHPPLPRPQQQQQAVSSYVNQFGYGATMVALSPYPASGLNYGEVGSSQARGLGSAGISTGNRWNDPGSHWASGARETDYSRVAALQPVVSRPAPLVQFGPPAAPKTPEMPVEMTGRVTRSQTKRKLATLTAAPESAHVTSLSPSSKNTSSSMLKMTTCPEAPSAQKQQQQLACHDYTSLQMTLMPQLSQSQSSFAHRPRFIPPPRISTTTTTAPYSVQSTQPHLYQQQEQHHAAALSHANPYLLPATQGYPYNSSCTGNFMPLSPQISLLPQSRFRDYNSNGTIHSQGIGAINLLQTPTYPVASPSLNTFQFNCRSNGAPPNTDNTFFYHQPALQSQPAYHAQQSANSILPPPHPLLQPPSYAPPEKLAEVIDLTRSESPGRRRGGGHAGKKRRVELAYPPPAPARALVSAVVVGQQDCDDKDGHYVVKEGDDLTTRYKIMRLLGQGTFGKVVEAYDRTRNVKVAIKIIRSIQKYRDAAKVEVRVLNALKKNDPTNSKRCIHLVSSFEHRNHTCMVFELLAQSVFDFLKENSFAPFPIAHIQSFSTQILEAVAFLHALRLIHTDLKPENLMLESTRCMPGLAAAPARRLLSPRVRLIDFGSAIFEDEYHSSVVSTRHYRAPEIILGTGWSFPCDIWSVGCILVEFFTGDALFQTHDNVEHLAMMEAVLGPLPEYIVRSIAPDRPATKFFNRAGRVQWPQAATSKASKKFVKGMCTLRQIIPGQDDVSRCFLDLVQRMLVYDPRQRITAQEALNHPFLRCYVQ